MIVCLVSKGGIEPPLLCVWFLVYIWVIQIGKDASRQQNFYNVHFIVTLTSLNGFLKSCGPQCLCRCTAYSIPVSAVVIWVSSVSSTFFSPLYQCCILIYLKMYFPQNNYLIYFGQHLQQNTSVCHTSLCYQCTYQWLILVVNHIPKHSRI